MENIPVSFSPDHLVSSLTLLLYQSNTFPLICSWIQNNGEKILYSLFINIKAVNIHNREICSAQIYSTLATNV